VALLFLTDERFLEHVAGKKHPESPARLEAVWKGLDNLLLEEDLVRIAPRIATETELLRCHPIEHIQALKLWMHRVGGVWILILESVQGRGMQLD